MQPKGPPLPCGKRFIIREPVTETCHERAPDPRLSKTEPQWCCADFDTCGAVITEPGVICEYLDEVSPSVNMLPQDPAEWATVRAWARYTDEVPTAAMVLSEAGQGADLLL